MNYPQYPEFEFPGRGNYLPSNLNGINAREWGELLAAAAEQGVNLNSVYADKLVDTVRFEAGTVTANEYVLFSVPIGGSTTPFNSTTQYKKSRIDTNMTQAAQLPSDHNFWIGNMQAKVAISGLLDNAVNSSGDNLGLASDPGLENQIVAADALNAVNLAQAILESMTITFNLDGTDFEGGALEEFPSRYGLSGFAGGFAYVPGTAGTTIAANETVVNNGFGQPFNWPIIRHLKGQQNFSVKVRAYNAFTNTRPFRIKVILEGLRAKPVVG